MVLWIGVDDTDSLRGLCTTYLASELVRDLRKDYDLIGYLRLVRLNPNIPWKTRGNGAVAIAVGRGYGSPFRVGRINGSDVWAYPSGVDGGEPRDLIDRLASVVERWSDLESPGTDPGLVVLSRKPPPSLYWKGVRDVVPAQVALRAVKGLGVHRGWKSGRGLIGASAACAWRPRDRTWELLAYRDRSRWGTPRKISAASVREMDRLFPSTFNNYDYENGRVVIAPRTRCPVLLGIRGDRPEDLPPALLTVRSEKPERWLIFETNQGTDDHVFPGPTDVPRTAGHFAGTVTGEPRTLPGGHVVFGLGKYDVTAYEPSRTFREVVRKLVVGDRVEVIGSLRETPRTINLEKLRIVSLRSVWMKTANPLCLPCGVRMKSLGRGAPFRCRRCGQRAPRSAAEYRPVERDLRLGWYEPPVGSRRHLSKPIKRMGVDGQVRPPAPPRSTRPLTAPAPAPLRGRRPWVAPSELAESPARGFGSVSRGTAPLSPGPR